MNRQLKRFRIVLLAAICLVLTFGAMAVQAKDMKSETSGRVVWGWKTNRKYVYYSYLGGVGMIKQNVKVTNWKDRKYGSTRRKLTFTITFIRKNKPTASQLINASTFYTIQHPELNSSPGCWFAVVDYYDGISLEDPNNPYGVRVSSKWKKSGVTTYRTPGYSLSMRNCAAYVTIIYPTSYKNMCIGFGGYNWPITTSSDKLFWDGIYPFWMTNSYMSPVYKRIAYFGRWWY